MRISTKGRYSLAALLCLALNADEENISTRDIAGETGVSESYLEQLFIPLRKAGLIVGMRGPLGGYSLAKPPRDISSGDILRAAEGSLRPTACVEDASCPAENVCQCRQTWSALNNVINECVDAISLESIVECYHKLNTLPEYAI
jgi:Rrf2 family protein